MAQAIDGCRFLWGGQMGKAELPIQQKIYFPLPIVVVSCSARAGGPNLIAVGSVSSACHDPPMWGVAIGHARYSYDVMSRSDGFVINVPSVDQVHIVDLCGTASGRDIDKFRECNLTPLASAKISSPGILEFPLNIECATRKSVQLGSHSFFFGEVRAIHCDESILNAKGEIDGERLQPMCLFLNSYWSLEEPLLEFGKGRLSPRRPLWRRVARRLLRSDRS